MIPQNQYWKYIDIPDLTTIQDKILAFIQNSTDIMNPRSFQNPMIPLTGRIIQHVPELDATFKNHFNKMIMFAAFYVTWEPKHGALHVDDLTQEHNRARVNIPILNCQDTYTAFYENVTFEREQLPNGEVFNRVKNTDYTEMTRVELNKPALLRVEKPHAIFMNMKNTPRISLTIATFPDSITLFRS